MILSWHGQLNGPSWRIKLPCHAWQSPERLRWLGCGGRGAVGVKRAHLLRFIVGFGGGVVAVALFFATHPPLLAVAVAIPVFLLTSLIAERLFRRYATALEIRRDLEDRVRNPPS